LWEVVMAETVLILGVAVTMLFACAVHFLALTP
jgi:hypothetical protein